MPPDVVIQIGLNGLPGTPRSVTATMSTPCSNIAGAARQIARLVAVCRTSTHSKADPNRCAIAAYHGSWQRPDNGFADMVLATAAKDFEKPAGTGNDTGEVSFSGHPTSPDTPPATAPSPTPHDDERARQSPLFPVMAKPSDSSPSQRRKRTHCPLANRNDVQTVPPTATEPHVDSVFVSRSVASTLRRNRK
jgi:hypothetical protein